MCAKLATHSSPFHCDEVLALVMLRQLPEYKTASVIRTRKPRDLASCQVVFDVGGEYNPARHRYDHHQPSFNVTIQDFFPSITPAIKLSSTGLIYAHFGKRVLATILQSSSSNSEMIDIIFSHVYTTFISEIDANDNGIPIASTPPNYIINTSLPMRVSRLNPPWNSKLLNETEAFDRAYEMVKDEFLNYVKYVASAWYPARAPVMKAIEGRFSFHPSGMILMLNFFCPWSDHFFSLEKELIHIDKDNETAGNFLGRPVFVIWKKTGKIRPAYGIHTIPYREDMPFTNRVMLPQEWAGKKDSELSRLVGIPGAIFVHTNRFCGEHQTLDGILKMATVSLKEAGYL